LNHPGTLVSNPVWTAGVAGAGLELGGTKRVDIGPWSGFCLTNAMSLAIWVKPVQLPTDNNYPFFCQSYGYYSGWGLRFVGPPADMRVVFQMTGMNGNSVASWGAVPTNRWIQIVATFDGQRARLYLDGQLEREATWNGARVTTNDVVTIGKLTYDNFGPGGTYDDARIYDRALTEAEVIGLFVGRDGDWDGLVDANEALLGTDTADADSDGDGFTDGVEVRGGTDPLNSASHPDFTGGLVGWWKLDESSGSAVADATTNANHGTITGTGVWVTGLASNALQLTTLAHYVGAGANSTGSVLAVTEPSFGFWCYVTNRQQTASVIDRWDGSKGYLVKWEDWANRVTAKFPGSAAVPVPLDAVREGTWNHLAFTYNGTQMCAYVNGRLTSVGSYTNFIGRSATKLYYQLVGVLDEVRVYGRGLGAGDVAALAWWDTDGDGLTDAEETRLGTSQTMVDTDGDGLGDIEELSWGSDWLNPDSDGDFWLDGAEVAASANPTVTTNHPPYAFQVGAGGGVVTNSE
jgi:hypothetical protein